MTATSARAVIADDDAVIRRVLGLLLQREGFEVHAASDGEQAVELARQLRPAVVFLDAMMPVTDGYNACRRIRAELDDASQPVVVMVTAAGQAEDREQAAAAGVDEFITKPFSPSRLSQQVREIRQRGGW
ncbi:MAG: response regulator [Actinomycetota bacterium]|nr:response regulator [Actinomycetota bacterium]